MATVLGQVLTAAQMCIRDSYITVQWDYHSATTRPEWLIRKQDGSQDVYKRQVLSSPGAGRLYQLDTIFTHPFP